VAIEVSVRVWNLATKAVTGTERLVLLYLADRAHRDGRNAWPAVRRIAACTSLSPRAVHYALSRLLQKGFLTKDGKMWRGAVRYALDLHALEDRARGADKWERARGADKSDRARGAPRGLHHVRGRGASGADKPSVNRHCEPSSTAEPRPADGRPRDRIPEPVEPEPHGAPTNTNSRKSSGAGAPPRTLTAGADADAAARERMRVALAARQRVGRHRTSH
jgi:helix-turn-helix protein